MSKGCEYLRQHFCEPLTASWLLCKGGLACVSVKGTCMVCLALTPQRLWSGL